MPDHHLPRTHTGVGPIEGDCPGCEVTFHAADTGALNETLAEHFARMHGPSRHVVEFSIAGLAPAMTEREAWQALTQALDTLNAGGLQVRTVDVERGAL